MDELGIKDCESLLSLPSETLSVSGLLKPDYASTEIFSEEVGLLVTGDSVYRETAYLVAMPFHDDFVTRFKRAMLSKALVYFPSYLTGNPLEYVRYHLIVS